jgi:hypothetical protein
MCVQFDTKGLIVARVCNYVMINLCVFLSVLCSFFLLKRADGQAVVAFLALLPTVLLTVRCAAPVDAQRTHTLTHTRAHARAPLQKHSRAALTHALTITSTHTMTRARSSRTRAGTQVVYMRIDNPRKAIKLLRHLGASAEVLQTVRRVEFNHEHKVLNTDIPLSFVHPALQIRS